MTPLQWLNRAVAATFGFFLLTAGALADETTLDQLFERLQADELPEWEEVENQIWAKWSQSGSDSMDLLLQRGRDAMEAEDFQAAIEHLTALTDHAPDFAEGYHQRATAYFHADLYGPSLADLKRTLTLVPRHFGAWSGLGTIMMEMGHEKLALRAYRRAHELNPHRPDFERAVNDLAIRFGERDL